MFKLLASSTSMFGGSGHLSAGVAFILVLLYIVLIVYAITVMWHVFKKAGRPGWAAIIPFYNGWVLFEIAGKPGWWVLSWVLAFIPVVGWIVPAVLYVIATLELAKRFGKDTVFAIFGLIIFSIVGLSIIAWGDAKYTRPKLNS